MQLDPEALNQNSRGGIAAQINSPEERARYDYMLAKIYACVCLKLLRSPLPSSHRRDTLAVFVSKQEWSGEHGYSCF